MHSVVSQDSPSTLRAGVATNSVTYLSTVDVLNGTLPEQEVDEAGSLERANELRLIKPLAVELLRACRRAADPGQAPGYSRIGSREVHGASDEVVPRVSQQRGDIGLGAVGTARQPAHPLQHAVHVLNLHLGRNSVLGHPFQML